MLKDYLVTRRMGKFWVLLLNILRLAAGKRTTCRDKKSLQKVSVTKLMENISILRITQAFFCLQSLY